MKKINTIHTLTKFVILSIVFVAVYTTTEFIVSTLTGVHHEVLTGCVYAFFGTEIAACGFIKIFKVKKEE